MYVVLKSLHVVIVFRSGTQDENKISKNQNEVPKIINLGHVDDGDIARRSDDPDDHPRNTTKKKIQIRISASLKMYDKF